MFAYGAAIAAMWATAWVARRLATDRFTISETRPVVSSVDGMRYRVHSDSQTAADTLAALNERIIELLRSLRGRYGRDAGPGPGPMITRRLLERYNPDNLAENSPRDPRGDTSYTIDKGAIVALCLRDRAPAAAVHDLDTLTFVALHELTHIAIEDVDHPPRFWVAFRFILVEAEDAGVFLSPNYAANPRRYCGLNIDYNPRYDAALG
jgi:hypothetical protein